MATYFITGASRGLGLEFVKRLCAREDTVIAAVRTPETATELKGLSATVVALDIKDPEQIAGLREVMAGKPVDVLINNAGINSEQNHLEDLKAGDLREVFMVNAIAPLLVARALLPSMKEGRRKKIVNISSGMGSIANNVRDRSGGSSYAYRGSKAALNMLTTCMANELRLDGFIVAAIDPGWVKTDMGGPNALLTPERSITNMLRIIDAMHGAQSGSYFDLDGRIVPW